MIINTALLDRYAGSAKPDPSPLKTGLSTSGAATHDEWLASRLTDSMLGTPSTMAIYLAGLSVAAAFLWQRTPDPFIGYASVMAVLLTAYRLAIIFVYACRTRRSLVHYRPRYVLLYCIGAWLYSVDLACLTICVFALGDLPSIMMSVVMFAGYLVGLIMRAAVIRFAVPSLFLLFVPLTAAGMFAGDGDYLVIAILLVLLCLACVRYASVARATIIGQLTAERRLADMVGRDPLTGIANRMGLERHIDYLRASGKGRLPFSVAALDLDGFKAVNDRHGHGIGDELLRKATERIGSVLAGRHKLFRLGGDEFFIVFETALDHAGAKALCEAIAELIRPTFPVETRCIRVTCSIGLARSKQGVTGFDAASKEADAALYRAKRLGRDRVSSLRERENASSGDPNEPNRSINEWTDCRAGNCK